MVLVGSSVGLPAAFRIQRFDRRARGRRELEALLRDGTDLEVPGLVADHGFGDAFGVELEAERDEGLGVHERLGPLDEGLVPVFGFQGEW